MSLLKLLGLDAGRRAAAPGAESETLRRIVAALESLDPQRANYIACFAFILSRVAHADLEISEPETREMERQVTQWGGLPEEQAILAVQIAKSQNRLFGGTDNFSVTKELKSISGEQQRRDLLRCLFAVSAADESVSVVEENEIWKIAAELGITHSEYVAIRSDYRSRREVLRNLPPRS